MTVKQDHTRVEAEQLMRIDDLANRLAISRSMAHKLTATGAIKAVKIGRAIRIRPSDVEIFIAEATRDS